MILCNILLPKPRSSNQSSFQSFPNSNFVRIYLLPHTATGSTLGIRGVISLMISSCGISALNPKLCLVRGIHHKAPYYPVFFFQPHITLSLLTPKFLPQHPILEHLVPVFFDVAIFRWTSQNLTCRLDFREPSFRT